SCSPRRKIGQRVCPADSDDAGFGCLPAVSAAAHPVIRVGERDAGDGVLTRKRDGVFHTVPSVQISRPAVSIPSFQSARSSDYVWFSVRNNDTALDHAYKLRKAVQSVGIDAVARCFGEESCAKFRALRSKTQSKQDFAERGEEFVEGNAHRAADSLQPTVHRNYRQSFQKDF